MKENPNRKKIADFKLGCNGCILISLAWINCCLMVLRASPMYFSKSLASSQMLGSYFDIHMFDIGRAGWEPIAKPWICQDGPSRVALLNSLFLIPRQ